MPGCGLRPNRQAFAAEQACMATPAFAAALVEPARSSLFNLREALMVPDPFNKEEVVNMSDASGGPDHSYISRSGLGGEPMQDYFRRMDSQKVNILFDKDETRRLIGEQIAKAGEEWRKENPEYPYQDGEYTVLGPEVVTDGKVIMWKGQNYSPQENEMVMSNLRKIISMHYGALIELLHDEGLRFSESTMRLHQMITDELTLTLPALAEQHPIILPRLPEGLKE